ncbi:MAG: alpha/beta hydrolase [Spirosomataceae bacterium]
MNNHLHTKWWTILLILGLNACQVFEIKPLIEEEMTVYKEVFNLPYGPEKTQSFDIHYPVSVKGRPSEVLILLHGGAWEGGDKSFLAPTVDALQKKQKNLTIVNMNYRLTGSLGVRLEQQLSDVQLLIDYLHQNTSQYNITDGAFIIGGVSAGGHLALDYAYLKANKNTIKGVIGIVAPTDLTSEALRNGGLEKPLQKLIGKTYIEAPEDYLHASPLHILTTNRIPTLLFYGGKDTIVPFEQGEKLKLKLTLLGIKSKYYFYPQETHDFSANLLADKILSMF